MSNDFGRLRGAFERECRATFKTLERATPGDPSDALAALDRVELAAGAARSALVHRLRDAGATWQDVADLLGTSRQSAWERFAPR